MKQKKNLIVFDIDGTLTDTVQIHHNAFRKALQFIGIKDFNNHFDSYKHHTDSHIAKTIYEASMNRLFDKSICKQFENYLYESIVNDRITEIRGSQNMVSYLENETEFGVCYATGSLYLPAKLKLERIGINFNSLQLVASNDIEEREKIVSTAIKNAQKHYRVRKFDRIISFGDGLWDLRTANNLSLEFVGIGNVNKEILQENGAKNHYPDFCTLIKDAPY